MSSEMVNSEQGEGRWGKISREKGDEKPPCHGSQKTPIIFVHLPPPKSWFCIIVGVISHIPIQCHGPPVRCQIPGSPCHLSHCRTCKKNHNEPVPFFCSGELFCQMLKFSQGELLLLQFIGKENFLHTRIALFGIGLDLALIIPVLVRFRMFTYLYFCSCWFVLIVANTPSCINWLELSIGPYMPSWHGFVLKVRQWQCRSATRL